MSAHREERGVRASTWFSLRRTSAPADVRRTENEQQQRTIDSVEFIRLLSRGIGARPAGDHGELAARDLAARIMSACIERFLRFHDSSPERRVGTSDRLEDSARAEKGRRRLSRPLTGTVARRGMLSERARQRYSRSTRRARTSRARQWLCDRARRPAESS